MCDNIQGKYDAVEVSRHIINYSCEIKSKINRFKLQQILFIIQVEFLIRSNGEYACFKDKIEINYIGEVKIDDVYEEYRLRGSCTMGQIKKIHTVEFVDQTFKHIYTNYDDNVISEIDKTAIDRITKRLKNSTYKQLATVIDSQGVLKLAKEVKVKGRFKSGIADVVSKEDLFKHYTKINESQKMKSAKEDNI